MENTNDQRKRPMGFATMEEIRIYFGISRTKMWRIVKEKFPKRPAHERLTPKQVNQLINDLEG